MSKNLVIVESPAKAKTISKYLGSDFVVEASVGHVRDLPRSAKGEPVPGVDLENDFKPTYEVTKDAKKVITNLKKLAKKADTVWFATDLIVKGKPSRGIWPNASVSNRRRPRESSSTRSRKPRSPGRSRNH